MWPGSQGDQDLKLRDIFAKVGTTNRVAVEFGFIEGSTGSNTWRMRLDAGTRKANLSAAQFGPWAGLLMGLQIRGDRGVLRYTPGGRRHGDGTMQTSYRRTWISSSNIVGLFEAHGVPAEPDYVSIDLDTSDLFVLRAIVSSRFRPRVLSIEYNSNFQEGASITHPDPEAHPVLAWNHSLGAEHRDRKNRTMALCYMGASAGAISLVAARHGYVVVDVTRGLDLFLVRREVWGSRAVPPLSSLRLHKCLNAPMTPAMAANLLDYRTLIDHGDADGEMALCQARAAAARELRALARSSACKCFQHLHHLKPVAC